MNETNFEKLTNLQNPIVKCPSCGAEYDISESVCPYCGSVNEFGQENAYMDHLEAIEDNLENMGKYAGESVKKEVKSIFRLIMIPLATLVAIVLLFIGIKTLITRYYSPNSEKKTLEWQTENFPILDEMYEKGDYEGMNAFIKEVLSDDSFRDKEVYNWSHYSFYTCYSHYDFLKDMETKAKDDPEYLEYMKDFVFYEAMELCYGNYDEMIRSHAITRDDYENIKGYREYAFSYMERHFGISDFDEVADRCRTDSGLIFDMDKIRTEMKKYEWVD